jgi:hypothetical protein
MQEQVENPFKRKARLGINPITIGEGGTKYIEVKSEKPEVFTKKDGDTVDFVLAVDMQSGEEGHFWLAGQLRHQLDKLTEERGTIMGLKLEITHKGLRPAMINGKEQDVNQYDVHELH